MKGTLEERFWAKVDKRGPDECWEWIADKSTCGYGMMWVMEKMVNAPRVSWELANGPIPEGMCICHHCDNPGCVNPGHLWLGTIADNHRDKMEKGRSTRGGRNSHAKLTEQDVREIRVMLGRGIPQRVIAKKYGATETLISKIKKGQRWGWLK